MATQKRRELMRHLGLKLLEHAAVEVRTYTNGWGDPIKVGVLKNPTYKRVWLDDPEQLDASGLGRLYDGTLVESYSEYIAATRSETYAYADMPVRIEGMYLDQTRNDRVHVYAVSRYGHQEQWVLRRGSAYAERISHSNIHDILSLENMTPVVGLRDLDPDFRVGVVLAYASMLRERRIAADYYATDDRITALTERFMDVMAVNRFGTPLPRALTWRPALGGYLMEPDEYSYLKNTLKYLGHRAGSGIELSEFLEEVSVAQSQSHHSHLVRRFLPRITDGWNATHPLEAIVYCQCGHVAAEDDVEETSSGQSVCRHCVDNGDWVWMEDTSAYGPATEAYIHPDGLYYSYPYDEDDESDNLPGIRNYGSNVCDYLRADKTIKPSAYGEFLMGIELEVVPTGHRRDAVQDTLDGLAHGYAILKEDGSLDEGGFEIVTAPRSLEEHIRRFGAWEPYRTLRAWDAGCCGTHVHISSKAFTAATLGKFIEFINSEKNDRFIREIAGRHPARDDQARDYCQRDGCAVGNPKKTLTDKSTSRYFMVNTTNLVPEEAERLGLDRTHCQGKPQNTIELRVFRASLKKARLLAQIEFAHAAVMFCRWSSMRELDKEHFLLWLRDMAGSYPNLAKWFGVRGNKKTIEPHPQVRVAEDV